DLANAEMKMEYKPPEVPPMAVSTTSVIWVKLLTPSETSRLLEASRSKIACAPLARVSPQSPSPATVS
ncbi:hypothetical protein WICPIJ_007959, partial [Wickerhamomyces pijperi]